MASYTIIFVTMCAVYVLLVKAEVTYEFVTEKPDDYPNFDDNPMIKRLAQSGFPSRVKRETPDDHCNPKHREKLCCAEKKVIKPYVIRMKEVNQTVVQSTKYFTQYVLDVSCKPGIENKPCFSDFREQIEARHLTPECKSVIGIISVLVYENGKYRWVNLDIGVECSCLLKSM